MAGIFDWLDTGDTSAPADEGGPAVPSSLSQSLGNIVDLAGLALYTKAVRPDQTPVAPTSPVQTATPMQSMVGPALVLGVVLIAAILIARR